MSMEFEKWSEEVVHQEVRMLKDLVINMEKRFDERFLKLEFITSNTQQILSDINEVVGPDKYLARNYSFDSNYSLLSEVSALEQSPTSGRTSPRYNSVNANEASPNEDLFYLRVLGFKLKINNPADSEDEKFNSLLKQFKDFLKKELKICKETIKELIVGCIVLHSNTTGAEPPLPPIIIIGFKKSSYLEAVHEYASSARILGYNFKVLSDKQMDKARDDTSYTFYFSLFERKLRLNQG